MFTKLLIYTMINRWLEQTIIGLDLCPFAHKPFREGKILIKELPAQESSEAQIDFLDSLDSFQAQSKFETALMVYPEWKLSFREFYYFLQDCEDLLVSLKLENEFQLVAFHPEFCFEGLEFSNRANLVNSSPLPLIHILKINDLDLLNLSMKEAVNLSLANAKKLELLSKEQLLNHFPWR